jgi:hypothetical protein
MNWEALGAVAEILGALGVIASLAYLAVQIRQNTALMDRTVRAARGAAYQEFLGYFQSATLPAVHDAAIAEIVRRGMIDVRSLNEAESFRFTWSMGAIIVTFDNALYQHDVGVLPVDRWQVLERQLRYYCRAPGFGPWFEEYSKETLSPEFVQLVNGILASLPLSPDRAGELGKEPL